MTGRAIDTGEPLAARDARLAREATERDAARGREKAEREARDTLASAAQAEEAARLETSRKENAEKAEREAATLRLADKWSYSVDEDAMTSKVARYAIIKSENTHAFGFPYTGDQHATLTLRVHPRYGRDVLFSIERGQLQCPSYEDCHVLVRFDDRPPIRWSAIGAADHDTTVLFLRNEAGFLQRVRASKVVRVGVPVYREGEPIFEFEVGGFDYSRYKTGP